MTHVIHEIPPVYDDRSKILILGSFPSVKSREGQFFYHHKQNRFWKVLAAVFEDTLPETIEEKKEFLLRHNIAIWDVKLPSTSPANASYSLERLISQWNQISNT